MEIYERLNEIRSCNTVQDLALNIWSLGLEEATGSSKKSYRDGFIDWVESFKSGGKSQWKYNTPEDLAEAIWPSFLDERGDTWFPLLRTELVKWIKNYK
jgi:hypothetical protein